MRRSRQPDGQSARLTPNQVVAYNLARARQLRDWTQEQAAEALAPYLGTKWSVANFSAIERSVDGGRIRQFTADDLLALSRGFDLPIGFFLAPPVSGPEGLRITTPDAKEDGADPMVLMDALLGTDDNFKYLEQFVESWGGLAGRRALIDDEGRWIDKGPVVPDQAPRARRLARLRAKMAISQEFGELEAARHVLRQLLDVLDDVDLPAAGHSSEEVQRREEERPSPRETGQARRTSRSEQRRTRSSERR
jgi:transcriptional regulator with XRE-family HTH domain